MPFKSPRQYNPSRHWTIEEETVQEAREIIADIAIQQLLIAVVLLDRWANKDPIKTGA